MFLSSDIQWLYHDIHYFIACSCKPDCKIYPLVLGILQALMKGWSTGSLHGCSKKVFKLMSGGSRSQKSDSTNERMMRKDTRWRFQLEAPPQRCEVNTEEESEREREGEEAEGEHSVLHSAASWHLSD